MTAVPAPGVKSPALWGTTAHLETLFGAGVSIVAKKKDFVFRYRSPRHWVEVFGNYYGPIVKAFAAVGPSGQASLEADLFQLLDEFDLAEDGTLVVPSEYLEVVITKMK